MDKQKKFDELENGIRLNGEEKCVHVAMNICRIDDFMSGNFDYKFLYVAIDSKNRYDGYFEALSLNQTVKLRDYLTELIELRG